MKKFAPGPALREASFSLTFAPSTISVIGSYLCDQWFPLSQEAVIQLFVEWSGGEGRRDELPSGALCHGAPAPVGELYIDFPGDPFEEFLRFGLAPDIRVDAQDFCPVYQAP
jgi:hypothetical protein